MSTAGPSRVRAPKKRGSYHHGDLRRALVQAALELVRRRGPEGVTLREAARRVGVSHAAPARHFATKEALLAAVAEEGFRALHDRLQAVAVTMAGADARARLRALGEATFLFYVADAARFRLMHGPAGTQRARYPGLAEAWQAVQTLLLTALRDSQHSGAIREADAMEVGLTVASLTHGLAALVIDGQFGPLAPEEAVALYRRANAVLYRGLHPRGAADV